MFIHDMFHYDQELCKIKHNTCPVTLKNKNEIKKNDLMFTWNKSE